MTTTFVELRAHSKKGTPLQTVVPPSVHVSGERIEFENDLPPTQVDGQDLEHRVMLLAIASLLVRVWPRTPGNRHEIALATSAVLLRSGLPQPDVEQLMNAVATVAGDDEVADRVRAVADSAEALENGQPVTGWPRLRELLGDDVVNTLGRWLGNKDTIDNAQSNSTALLALDEAAQIPESIYLLLPDLLQEACGTFEQPHERGVFLLGTLAVLSSVMPNVAGYYGNNSELLTPNLYAGIVAGAASGKGVLRFSRRLVAAVDDLLRQESDAARQQWLEDKGQASIDEEPFNEPEPPRQSLILPANASAAAFHKALHDRKGRGLIIETEIDTLVNALRQEWGTFDDTLRKAFHHEPVSYLRVKEEVSIERPQLSVVLSGTEQQFRNLIRSAENGLYSRIALYYFKGNAVWVDQRPTSEAATKNELFDRLAAYVRDKLFLPLRDRRRTLHFVMKREHWDKHRTTFATLLKSLHKEGITRLDDVIKRAGLIAFRFAMVLRVLRAIDEQEMLDDRMVRLLATDHDIEVAFCVASIYADHALRFSRTLTEQPPPDPQTQRIRRLLEALPATFDNKQVFSRAKGLGFGVDRRTLD